MTRAGGVGMIILYLFFVVVHLIFSNL
jgi:hypothetical protein